MISNKEGLVNDIMRALSTIVYPILGGVCIEPRELDNEKVSFHVYNVPLEELDNLSGLDRVKSEVFSTTFELNKVDYSSRYSVSKTRDSMINRLQNELIEELQE